MYTKHFPSQSFIVSWDSCKLLSEFKRERSQQWRKKLCLRTIIEPQSRICGNGLQEVPTYDISSQAQKRYFHYTYHSQMSDVRAHDTHRKMKK